MGRPVSFDFTTGGGSPEEFLMGTVYLEPTLMHTVGSTVVLPDAPYPVKLVNGKAVHPNVAVSPAGPEPEWAYKVTIENELTGKAWSEFRGVPTGTTQIAYKDLTKFVTTIPPQTTAGMMQNWADTTEANAERSELAADRAEAPTDLMNKNLIEDTASLTSVALSDAIVKGAADFGASDAVQPFLSLIENNVRDTHMLLIGDSTGNETWEWAYLFFQDLASRYPSHTFEYRLWNDSSQSYDPAVVIGTGARKVTLWNASFAGATTQSWQAARITPAVYDVPADLVMISIGHNEGSGTTYPWAWRARYLSLTESIKAKKPTATMVLVGQNPATANNWQAQRIEVYKEIAARQGYGFIDAHAAFVEAGGDLTIDGIHPNPTGARLWADVMLAAFLRTKAAPRPQQASLLTRRTVENKMPNSIFDEWTASTPTGWTLSNVTSEKVTTGTESGANAVKLTSTATNSSMYMNIPASTVAGKTFTMAVRAKIGAGATGLPGRIGFYDNIGGAKLQANGSEPTDGYRWILHEGSFSAGATSARIYIYAGNAGDTITVDRIILTEGIDPTDAAQLATSTGGGSTGPISTGWVELTGLTLGTGVTVDKVRVKREGSLVFCHIMNLVIPSDATASTVITGIPSGFRSVSGPSGAVGSTWSLGKLAGNQSPFLQQNMSISNNYIRWEGAQDVRNGTVLTAPTRIDGVMMWNTDDPAPS